MLLSVFDQVDGSRVLTDTGACWDFVLTGETLSVYPAVDGAVVPVVQVRCRAKTLEGVRRRCAWFVSEYGEWREPRWDVQRMRTFDRMVSRLRL